MFPHDFLKINNTITMKKGMKIFLFFICIIGVLLLSFIIYAVSVTSAYSLDKNKLIDTEYTIEYYDINGDELSVFSGENLVSENESIPRTVKNAFIAVEDKRFYEHNGIDTKALARAFFNNIKSFSFKEGASTISQQLIKNTHLSNEKTIRRKLIEFKLTRRLEKEFTKEEILQMYLNTIYFGKNSYGITSAARNYFNKNVEDLSLSEAATLAGIVKAPSAYSPVENKDKCKSRRNLVLKLMLEQNMISEENYSSAVNEEIVLSDNDQSESAFYLAKAKEEMEKIFNLSPYSVKKCRVYTFYDPIKQSYLRHCAETDGNSRFTGIIYNNETNGIEAYLSDNHDEKRQAGSALKPLCVYAPAIENNYVSECSPILDEKIEIGGYSPSNYNDKYDGYISVKQSLEKSSNVCAVKILNALGVKKACEFLEKAGIETVEEDQTLALALGSSTYGVSLKTLTSAYGVFSGYGKMQEPVFIRKIMAEDQLKYEYIPQKRTVMSEAGACMMNYMLKGVCKNGTAKKLGALNMEIAGKTGTVGNKNGNTDAYCISYSPEFTVGIRYSSGETLLPNNVTGGALPTTKSFYIWKNIGGDQTKKFLESDNIVRCELDKVSYEQDHLLVLAGDKTPAKYKTEGLFIKNYVPKEISTRFSTPKIKSANLSVKNNEIYIELCQEEYYDYLIIEEIDGKKTQIFDSANATDKPYVYTEQMTQAGKIYSYYAIPYFKNGDETIYGEELLLGKAKCKLTEVPDDWWLEFDP